MNYHQCTCAVNTSDVLVIPLGPAIVGDVNSQFNSPPCKQHPYKQCICWEHLIAAKQLLEEPSDVINELCSYHHHYLFRRIRLKKGHNCPCHVEPDCGNRCLACGFCHACGCDLITTSTPQFHRCSCAHCLQRCCPHTPDLLGVQQAVIRHSFLQSLQQAERCQPGATTSDYYRDPRPLTTEEQRELQERYKAIPLISQGDAPINGRWPSTTGYATDAATFEPGAPTVSAHPPQPRTRGRAAELSLTSYRRSQIASQSAQPETTTTSETTIQSPDSESSSAADNLVEHSRAAVKPDANQLPLWPPLVPRVRQPLQPGVRPSPIGDDWDTGH